FRHQQRLPLCQQGCRRQLDASRRASADHLLGRDARGGMMPEGHPHAVTGTTLMPECRVTVRLPTALLALFPEIPPRVQVAATSVEEAIAALDARWPGIRDRLCDSRPAIRKHINVFVNGERVSLEAPLATDSEVFIL